MNKPTAFDFGKFVPGFDFLQGLAQGASKSLPGVPPSVASWIAPTLSVEDIDKRIDELKAVQFWLDQNATALKATIQALEVQKMTLATLRGMNFNMADMANAFKIKLADGVAAGAGKLADVADSVAQQVPPPAPAPVSAAEPPATPAPVKRARRKPAAAPAASGVIDPMLWWGALTQQFQQIAGQALKDASRQTAVDATRNLATGLTQGAVKTASGVTKAAAGLAVGTAKTAARKAASAVSRPPARRAAKRAR